MQISQTWVFMLVALACQLDFSAEMPPMPSPSCPLSLQSMTDYDSMLLAAHNGSIHLLLKRWTDGREMEERRWVSSMAWEVFITDEMKNEGTKDDSQRRKRWRKGIEEEEEEEEEHGHPPSTPQVGAMVMMWAAGIGYSLTFKQEKWYVQQQQHLLGKDKETFDDLLYYLWWWYVMWSDCLKWLLQDWEQAQ